jgi:hypothetical protein
MPGSAARVRSVFAAVTVAGVILAGCGSHSAARATNPDRGYVTGIAYPCDGLGNSEPAAHIELVIVGQGSSRFTARTTWIDGVHHFRFAAHAGRYRIYEEQSYVGQYERVGGPFAIRVLTGMTIDITVASGCK